MKKILISVLAFLFIGIFFVTDSTLVHAEIKRDDYFWEELPRYPYREDQTTSYQNRFKWESNKIYTKVDYGTWIKPDKAGQLWIQPPHMDGTGVYVNKNIYRRFYGQDNFWLTNMYTGKTIAQWSAKRLDAVYGEPYSWSPCGPTVYRRETGWIDIGGAKPNIPTGSFSQSNGKFYFNVSGTSSNLAVFKADFSWSNPATGEGNYTPTGAGVSNQAEDYVTGFYYKIDKNPISVVSSSDLVSKNGIIDVSQYFTSNENWYIHVVTRSYTHLLSDRLDLPIKDVSLKKTLTLTKDNGIKEVIGSGSYYPGQTVTINAKVRDSGFKWSKWTGAQNIASQTYSFVMPNENITYHATTTPYQYEIIFNGNGATKGEMQPIKAIYDDAIKLPPNSFIRDNVVCKYMGWNLNVGDSTLITDQSTIKVADLVDILKIGNTDGKIPLFAIWDDAPVIKAEDRYISRAQAASGFITESEIINNIHVTDKEDGVIPKEQIKLLYFDSEEFKQALGIYGISVNIHAFDSVGNESEIMIMVNIVDSTVTEEVEPNARFISLKYLDKPESEGGLYEDSIWKSGERYDILKNTLANELLDQEVAELKLFGFTLKKKRPGSGHYNITPEETRYYDEEEIKLLKDMYDKDF